MSTPSGLVAQSEEKGTAMARSLRKGHLVAPYSSTYYQDHSLNKADFHEYNEALFDL